MTEFLAAAVLGQPLWMWLAFAGLVVLLLFLDLGVLHRGQREIGVRESLLLSAGYLSLGLAFGGWLWFQLGREAGLEYVTGFLIEKSLALDNVFVIATIFGAFAVPRAYQHRVLFWGILGVIVLRAIMIGLGTALVQRFDWILYVFGAFLLFTGVKMLFSREEQHPDLAGDLSGGQVADKAHLAGQAEGACHGAADLRRDAEGHRRRIGDEDRFDLPPVREAQQEFLRPVG